ncbi:TVAZ2 protein, partial [Alopecoenas beccarii]|nr:TVAZ2 protein [Alopecoenas beccarii]
FFSAVTLGRAQVVQEPSAETTQGIGINITCSHPKIDADFTRWYRQIRDQRPELVATGVRGTKTLQDPPGRLSVGADRRSSALWLAQPRRGDAALYYCAVRD